MANLLTALDLIKLNGGALHPLVDEVAVVAPEFGLLPAEQIPGTSITVSVRTGLPTVEFRHANEGVSPSKSTYASRVFETFIVDSQAQVDKALADSHHDKNALFDDEAVGRMKAALKLVGEQMYYGNPDAEDKGFPGLIAQAASDTAHVVDATGTSAKSSVWGLAVGRDGAQFIVTGNAPLKMGDEWITESVTDANGKKFQAYVNWLSGRVGFKLSNKDAAFRIKNIGTAAGKTLTDAMLADMVQLADEKGVKLTHILMTPRSRTQLKKSRTATNPTGIPAPTPTDYEGIPIVVTNCISNDE